MQDEDIALLYDIEVYYFQFVIQLLTLYVAVHCDIMADIYDYCKINNITKNTHELALRFLQNGGKKFVAEKLVSKLNLVTNFKECEIFCNSSINRINGFVGFAYDEIFTVLNYFSGFFLHFNDSLENKFISLPEKLKVLQNQRFE